jgi:hypothetical protein
MFGESGSSVTQRESPSKDSPDESFNSGDHIFRFPYLSQDLLDIIADWRWGQGIPFSCRSCKQILYAALVEHLPLGVSFQQRMSFSLIGRMGMARMLSAVL